MTGEAPVLVAYRRTAIGRARKGSLATERPEDLALTAVRAVLADLPQLDPRELADFYVGCAVPEGPQGDNIGRRIAVLAGMDHLPSVSVNRFCASSLQATAMAAQAIRAGDADAVLVGGVESTSLQPPRSRDLYPGSAERAERWQRVLESGRPWHDPREDGAEPDAYVSLGATAEFVARLTATTREDQDAWAVRSQERAVAARSSGFFAGEIAPHRRLDGVVVDADDGPRPGTTTEVLAGLPPAFLPTGTVTAGNASPLNDGASALVVMSARRARELAVTPIARILGTTVSAVSPEIMGLGPIEAVRRLRTRLGWSISDIEVVELNEAFAAQVVPIVRDLELDPDRVNPHGGAIALGHPFGMTGARLVGTLARALAERDATLGIATLCVGGGQGMALALERVS